jgi:hypothetical protein
MSVLKPTSDATVLRPDAFWDTKSGGGVRCSSEGSEGNRYHDPGSAYSEITGRSVASLLPGGPGVRGVIVPRATWWGGSRGFDPHQPRLMNIDPDIKGQASVVDLSQFSKEAVAAAYELAWQQVGDYGDPRLVASQAYRNLAIDTEPVGMGPDSRRSPVEARQAPLMGLDTYVVPKAAPGGGQMPLQPIQPLAMMPEEVPVSPSVATGAPSKPKADPGSVLAYNKPEDTSKMTKAQYRQAAKESSAALMAKLGVQRDPRAAEEDEQQIVVLDTPPVPRQPRPQPQPRTEQNPVFQEQAAPRAQLVGVPAPQAPQTQQYSPPGGFRDQTPVQAQPQFLPGMLQGQPVAQPTSIQQGQPPTTEVLFEIEGWGQIPLAYHKVIRNGLLLVLGWDKRWPTGKSFPPASDKVMAAHVKGTNKVFFVHSTNSTFEDGNIEYCILLIAKEAVQEPSQG